MIVPETRDVMGVSVSDVTYSTLNQFILERVRHCEQIPIFNVNLHAMDIAARDPEFLKILCSSPLVFPDGMGIVFAARLLGQKLSMRVTYADWIWDFARFSAANGISWFLLGARPGIAELAARRLEDTNAELRIVGTHHGFFEKSGPENDQVLREINRKQPDVLLVSFGMPLQEKWIAANQWRIDAIVLLSSGACLDYVSGTASRCPDWMGRYGLEWSYRLAMEPRRLWRRYLLGNVRFGIRLLDYYLRGLRQ